MDDEKFWYLDRWGRLRSMILRVAYNDIDILLAYCTMPHQVEEARSRTALAENRLHVVAYQPC